MNKKAIAILGLIFLLIVGTLGFLIYSKYGSSNTTKTTTTATPNNPTSPTPSPVADPAPSPVPTPPAVPPVVKLTPDQVISPTPFFDGSGVTYFDTQGNLYKATFGESQGTIVFVDKKSLEIEHKANISKILWPLAGKNFIAEINSNGKKTWSFFDSAQAVYVDLPSNIYSLDWMPSGDKIYYVWSNPDKNDTVNISDPDIKNYVKVSEIWDKNAVVSVSPDGLNILYYKDVNTELVNKIVQTTPDGKLWRAVVKDGYNYGVLWSPDSQKFLFAKKEPNSQNYQLWYYGLLSGEVKNLGLFTTPAKAVWDKDSQHIYAAVPVSGTVQDGSLTTDSFYKMDTATLEKKEYTTGDAKVDARDLFLNPKTTNPNFNKLFFRNAQDGGLYYLDISQ